MRTVKKSLFTSKSSAGSMPLRCRTSGLSPSMLPSVSSVTAPYGFPPPVPLDVVPVVPDMADDPLVFEASGASRRRSMIFCA
jgi:hypothetical protein